MKRLLLLTLSLLTSAAAGWQSAAIPDNPAGQQLAKTMAASASDSGADVAAFVKTFSASLLAVVPMALCTISLGEDAHPRTPPRKRPRTQFTASSSPRLQVGVRGKTVV